MSSQLDLYLTFSFDPKTVLICLEFFYHVTLVYNAEVFPRILNLINTSI